jgi:pimeloyl-ACP methyl ester carboxylesterase
MREPLSRRLWGDGVQLQVYEWPGEGDPILLCHATGFHARCWDQVVANLPGRQVYALDFRGHGLSDKPAPPYVWRNFGMDLIHVVEQLGLEQAIGVGHSKGGYAVTMAAAACPGAFRSLLLVDPVILTPEAYAAMSSPEAKHNHFASRRRNAWTSIDEMVDRFAGRPPFASWQPEVLRDYATYGLLPDPDGEGLVLACPPEIEAATYAGSAGGGQIYDDVAAVDVPVRVLRARARGEMVEGAPIDMSGSPTAADLASRFRRGEDVYLADHSHFIPMEDPALVARHILEMAER